jgi:hypothetical protein
MTKTKPINLAAKSLSDRRFSAKIVLSKKAYTRKGRHEVRFLNDIPRTKPSGIS